MKFLKQKGDTCIIYALAMVLDIDPEVIIEEIGHDGQEIWYPEQVGCQQKRGIHIQELQTVCATRGKLLAPVEVMPRLGPEGRFIFTEEAGILRFLFLINERSGIMISENHAYAWDGQILHDPATGSPKQLTDIRIKECWLLAESNQSEN